MVTNMRALIATALCLAGLLLCQACSDSVAPPPPARADFTGYFFSRNEDSITYSVFRNGVDFGRATVQYFEKDNNNYDIIVYTYPPTGENGTHFTSFTRKPDSWVLDYPDGSLFRLPSQFVIEEELVKEPGSVFEWAKPRLEE